MKPAFHRLTRRQFLLGTGGAALALPLLPSLLPRDAEAQAVATDASQRYFAHMTTWHGVFQDQFFGSLLEQAPTATMQFAGVTVRSAPLASTTQGDRTVISDCLRARSSALSPRILSLMNVINGLDFPKSPGHNRGGPLGYYGESATVDQVLAASKTFYPSTVLQPAIVRNPVSFYKSTSSGITQTPATAESNVKLFDRLFQTTTAPDQVVLVDRVKEHAGLVINDPQCSAQCRTRLTEYLDMLSELQAKLALTGGTSLPRPSIDTGALESATGFYGTPSSHVQCEQLWNDVVVAAFTAGISRVYACGPTTYTFGPLPEHAWHNDYAHGLDDPARKAGFSAAVQLQFEGALLDLANKLDQVTTADGKTLLDKSLLATGFELGSGGNPGHHHNRCIPVVSIGNANGFFRTGQSLDYRDLNSFSWSSNPHWYSGLLYNQWLGMVLRSMGIAPAEYAAGMAGDWGYPSIRDANGDHTDAIWNAAASDLPWLKA
jgi:hypothetical protein